MDYVAEYISPIITQIEIDYPLCKNCDHGFIDVDYQDHLLISRICPCFKKRMTYKNMAMSGIPRRYWEFYDREPFFGKNNHDVYKLVDTKRSAVFWGPSFTSKTTAATYILMKKLLEGGKSGYWWKHSIFCQLIIKAKFDDELFNYIQKTLTKDVIILDELGWSTIKNQETVINETMRMIRQVFENGSTLLVTTNYPEKDILDMYGAPLYNTLFKTNSKILSFDEVYSGR